MEIKEDRERNTEEEDKSSPVKSDDQPDVGEHPGKIFGNFLEEHDVSAEEPEHEEHEPSTEESKVSAMEQPTKLVEEPLLPKTPEFLSQGSKGTDIGEQPINPSAGLPGAHSQPVLVQQPPVTPPIGHSSNNSMEAEKDPASDSELPPIPTAVQPNRSRKLSELMTLAYKQRKEINRADFQQLVKRRSNYYEKHTSVYDHATFSLLSRMKETNEFIPSIVKYYNQLADIYKGFQEGSRKMSAFRFLVEPTDTKKGPDARLGWSSDINRGIKGMLELKDQTSGKMKSIENELLTNLLPSLQKALSSYNKRLEHLHKLSDKLKEKYLSSEQDVQKKVKKVNKLFSEENPEGKDKKDLLATELDVFTEFNKSKGDLTEWGVALQNWWKQAIATEKLLVANIKKSVLSLLELYGQLHGPGEKLQHCGLYWQQLDCNIDVDKKYSLASILPLSQYDFFKVSMISMYDRSKHEYTLEDWEKFGQLEAEDKVMGDRKALLHSLILKRFDCQMLEGDRPKYRATVASTVDEFLVFYDDSELTCYNRMQLKRLTNTRRSDYQVCVNEKIEGFIVDSWNKEVLHFRTSDNAEQFMFYTENAPDVKKEYVVS